MKLRITDWDLHFENASSRKLKRLDWVAIPNKTDGEGYTALVDHANAAAHLGAWYAIVEAASKQSPRGTLPGGIPQDIGGICRSLGRMSRLPSRIFSEVIPRLLEIGWLEEFQISEDESNQQSVAVYLAESANAVGDSGRLVAAQGRELHGTTVQGKNKSKMPSAKSALDLASPDIGFDLSGEACTQVGPAKKSRKRSWQTMESVVASLGPERMKWWDAFWAEWVRHEGKLPAMAAFERKVKTREVAEKAWRGARQYKAQMLERWKIEPNAPYKWAEGWINEERWNDDAPIVPAQPRQETSAEKRRRETGAGIRALEELNAR